MRRCETWHPAPSATARPGGAGTGRPCASPRPGRGVPGRSAPLRPSFPRRRHRRSEDAPGPASKPSGGEPTDRAWAPRRFWQRNGMVPRWSGSPGVWRPAGGGRSGNRQSHSGWEDRNGRVRPAPGRCRYRRFHPPSLPEGAASENRPAIRGAPPILCCAL